MAPMQSIVGSTACVVVALSLGLSEATVTRGANANEHSTSASSSSTMWISSQKLARGSTARNVAAAQYAITANRGFFSWWPSFGWRSFIGWWASWGKTFQTKIDSSSKLDAIVDTSGERKEKDVNASSKSLKEISKATERSFTQHDLSVATVTGMYESLDESGYVMVAKTRSEEAMVNFMRRATSGEGLEVVDNETLLDVVKFYDGECATQSYRNLVEELHRAEHPYLCHRPWTAKVGGQVTTEDAAIAALAALGGHVITTKGGNHGNGSGAGSTASLNEHGYQAVAETTSTVEMMVYIERVLASLQLQVVDKAGLQHFAPYYSGQCARQSYSRLVKELTMAPTRPHSCGGGWVAGL